MLEGITASALAATRILAGEGAALRAAAGTLTIMFRTHDGAGF